MTRKVRYSVIATCAVLAAAGSPALADDPNFAYQTIDPPGSTMTLATGLNDAGAVVGYYVDANSNVHGFIWNNGSFTIFDGPPGTVSPTPVAINNNGWVPFDAVIPEVGEDGLTRRPNGSFRNESNVKGAQAYPQAINVHNATAGSISFPGDPITHAYVRGPGNAYAQIDPPNSIYAQPLWINDKGSVVGFYEDSGRVEHGFSLIGGVSTSFNIPGGTTTQPNFISANNKIIAGAYKASSGIYTGFVMNGVHVRTIGAKSWTLTEVLAVLPGGQVFGVFDDKKGAAHGFFVNHGIHVLVPFYGQHKVGSQGVTIYQVNAHGSVAGYYRDRKSMFHGFIGVCKTPLCGG